MMMMYRASIALGLAADLFAQAGTFRPPDAAIRRAAIGNLDALPPRLCRAFEPGTDFQPLPRPGPHDWLAVHAEPGQTFDQYVQSHARSRPFRGKILLVILGSFRDPLLPAPDILRQFLSACFGLPCELRSIPPPQIGRFTTRTNPFTRERQILTRDVLRSLRRLRTGEIRLVLAVTMEDLYPDPAWNFVFGEASPRDGVGVSSFHRYLPGFTGEKLENRARLVVHTRAFRVIAHETGHLLGLRHCIWYRCVMNGSNHLAESDARPLHFCPVDLHKLQWLIGFDPVQRYRRLEALYRRTGLVEEAAWIQHRIDWITSGEDAGRTGSAR